MLVFQVGQPLRCQVFRVVEHHQDAVVLLQGFFIPFGFAVLAADDQGFAAVGKAFVAQDRQAEGCLAAFNEAGDQVYRYESANHR